MDRPLGSTRYQSSRLEVLSAGVPRTIVRPSGAQTASEGFRTEAMGRARPFSAVTTHARVSRIFPLALSGARTEKRVLSGDHPKILVTLRMPDQAIFRLSIESTPSRVR